MEPIPREPTTPKERRAVLKARIKEMMQKKHEQKMFHAMADMPDRMLVRLRDRLTNRTNLDQAVVVDSVRDFRIRGAPLPPPSP